MANKNTLIGLVLAVGAVIGIGFLLKGKTQTPGPTEPKPVPIGPVPEEEAEWLMPTGASPIDSLITGLSRMDDNTRGNLKLVRRYQASFSYTMQVRLKDRGYIRLTYPQWTLSYAANLTQTGVKRVILYQDIAGTYYHHVDEMEIRVTGQGGEFWVELADLAGQSLLTIYVPQAGTYAVKLGQAQTT